MEWLKWYAGSASDPKMAVVARRSGQNVAAVIGVWAMLLERAGAAAEGGNIEGFDCEAADVALGLEDGAACAILEAMQAKGMLDDDRVTHWDERQKKPDETAAATERKQLQREREKLTAERERLEVLRDELAGLSRSVTPSHAESAGVTADVTDGHGASRDVTLREDKKREEIKNIYTAPAAPDAAHTNVSPSPEETGKEPEEAFAVQNAPAKPESSYGTRRGRLLTGRRLAAFLRFWEAFGYQRGKAEAADAWLDIPGLTEALVARICDAAEQEAAGRHALRDRGGTPKMAQGWLTGRRWEDFEPSGPGKGRAGPVVADIEPPAVDWEVAKARLLAGRRTEARP